MKFFTFGFFLCVYPFTVVALFFQNVITLSIIFDFILDPTFYFFADSLAFLHSFSHILFIVGLLLLLFGCNKTREHDQTFRPIMNWCIAIGIIEIISPLFSFKPMQSLIPSFIFKIGVLCLFFAILSSIKKLEYKLSYNLNSKNLFISFFPFAIGTMLLHLFPSVIILLVLPTINNSYENTTISIMTVLIILLYIVATVPFVILLGQLHKTTKLFKVYEESSSKDVTTNF